RSPASPLNCPRPPFALFPSPPPPQNPSTPTRPAPPCRALRRRGLTSPPHRSLPRVAQKLRSAARDLPKPAFPELYLRRAGIASDFNSGENGPPSQFLAATGAPAALTPVASSQEYHESSRGNPD